MEKMNRDIVIALVNTKSGGKRAATYVHDKLVAEYGENCVMTLFDGPQPETFFADTQDFITAHNPDVVVVAGGDGTMSFAMDVIKDLHDRHVLGSDKGVVAPFPLGTGNDLSCTLGFGGGFARWFVLGGLRFRRMVRLFQRAKEVQLDRWALRVYSSSAQRSDAKRDPPDTRCPTGQAKSTFIEQKIMNNYFSVGFDAAVAARLNGFRQRHPRYFLTRPIVKLWYALFASMALATEKTLGDSVQVFVDGKNVPVPDDAKALVVANVLTYAGGSILWGPNSKTERSLYRTPSLSDGTLEIVSLTGVWHLAFVRLGLCHGTKLGQGERVEVVSSAANHHQYDGEPIAVFADSNNSATQSVRFEIQYFSNANILQAHLPRRHVFSILLTSLMVVFTLWICCRFLLWRVSSLTVSAWNALR